MSGISINASMGRALPAVQAAYDTPLAAGAGAIMAGPAALTLWGKVESMVNSKTKYPPDVMKAVRTMHTEIGRVRSMQAQAII